MYVQGSSDMDQLGKIFQAFGTPTPSQWPDLEYLPDYVEYQFVQAQPLRKFFPMANDDAMDLLSRMFTYDPKSRITAQQALEHRYEMLLFFRYNTHFLFFCFINQVSSQVLLICTFTYRS